MYDENDVYMGGDYKQKSNRPAKKSGRVRTIVLIVCGVLAAIVALVLLLASVTTVGDGYTGCLYRFGELQSTDIGKGLKFHAPFIESVTKVDIKEQMIEGNATAYSSDGQVIESLYYSVNYTYDQSRLDELIRNVGINNVPTRLIYPQVDSLMKNVIGKYKAEVLIQNRSECQESIEEALREYLDDYGVYVNSFALRNLDFEDSFEAAVRLKVEMEQKAQTAKNETELKKEEANQAVIAAEADASAAKLAADAEAYAIEVIQKQLASSPNYVELQKIQKWNGVFPEIMGNTVNPFVTLQGGTGGTTSTATPSPTPSATPEG